MHRHARCCLSRIVFNECGEIINDQHSTKDLWSRRFRFPSANRRAIQSLTDDDISTSAPGTSTAFVNHSLETAVCTLVLTVYSLAIGETLVHKLRSCFAFFCAIALAPTVPLLVGMRELLSRIGLVAVVAFGLAIAVSTPAVAQQSGTVEGIVKDPTGAVVSGATVTI